MDLEILFPYFPLFFFPPVPSIYLESPKSADIRGEKYNPNLKIREINKNQHSETA